uniref:Outer membrane protein beta-barrel domain-containing protein n=1 Tax=mine drainage metagenome TaxID=410659 RepID=E6QKZ3_9ZZZZ
MSTWLRFSSILLLLAGSVSAIAAVPVVWNAVPPNELYGGYSYVTKSYDQTQNNTISGGMNGWQASFKMRVLPWIGLKFDASGYYRSTQYTNPQAYFLLLGPQVSQHFGRYNLFVHGLIGIAHLNGEQPSTSGQLNTNSTGFPLVSNVTLAAAVGGGVDRAFNHFLAWRITGDFLHTNFQPGGSAQNQLQIVSSDGRISTGPVLRF